MHTLRHPSFKKKGSDASHQGRQSNPSFSCQITQRSHAPLTEPLPRGPASVTHHAPSCIFLHLNGADGETRTLTAFATAPSRRRVYQFHHVGMNGLKTRPCRLSDPLPRPKRAPLYYFGTSFAFDFPEPPVSDGESAPPAVALEASVRAGSDGTGTEGTEDCSLTVSITPPATVGRCVA